MRNPEFLHRMGKSDIEASRSVINMAKDFAELNRLENEAGIQAPEAGTKEQLVNKFVKAWENETARRAVKGGTGLTMAPTLAACGGSSGGGFAFAPSTQGDDAPTPTESPRVCRRPST